MTQKSNFVDGFFHQMLAQVGVGAFEVQISQGRSQYIAHIVVQIPTNRFHFYFANLFHGFF